MAMTMFSPSIRQGFEFDGFLKEYNHGTLIRREMQITKMATPLAISNSSGYSAIEINLPISGFIDMRHSWLSALLTIAAGTTTGLALTTAGLAGLFKSITIATSGGTDLWETGNVREKEAFFAKLLSPDMLSTHMYHFGQGTLADRQAICAGTQGGRWSWTSKCEPLWGLDIHLPAFPTSIVMKYNIDTDANGLVSVTGTDATFSLTDARANWDILYMHPKVVQGVLAQLAGGGSITAIVDCFDYKRREIAVADGATVDIQCNTWTSDLKAMFFMFKPKSVLNVQTADDTDAYYYPNVNTARLKIGSDKFPYDNLDCTGTGLDAMYYARFVQARFHTVAPALVEYGQNFTTFNGGSGASFVIPFLVGTDIAASFGGGYRTENPNQHMFLELIMSGAVSVATTVDIIGWCTAAVIWRSGALYYVKSGLMLELPEARAGPAIEEIE